MEHQTLFNLNNALAAWREELVRQPGLPEDSVRELEQHLEESMSELQTRGLNEEESFFVARRRVGPAMGLAAEFCKSDPGAVWRYRVLWMVVGWLVMILWSNGVAPAYVAAYVSIGVLIGGVSTTGPFIASIITMLPLVFGFLLVHGRFVGPIGRLAALFSDRRRTFLTVSIASSLVIGSGQFLVVWLQNRPFNWSILGWCFSHGAFIGILQGLLVSWLLPAAKQRALVST